MTTHDAEDGWISSNRTDDAPWHAAVKHESRGARTGRVLATYYLTLCSGQQLGGPYGYSRVATLAERAAVCSRCQKLVAK